PRPVPGPAVRRRRVRPERLRPRGRELLGVRTHHPPSRDRPPPRAEGRGGHGRVDAAGGLPVPSPRGEPGTRGLWGRAHRVRTPPAPLRGEPGLPPGPPGTRPVLQRALPGPPPRRDHRAPR